jgi:transcriptional regulator with XRE-family HTH domain
MVPIQTAMELPILAPMAQTLDELARSQIRKWIHSTGITQTALAERVGRNQAWMSRYLGGAFDADLETLQKIAQVFGHSLTSVLDVPKDPEEAALVTAYRALRPEARALALSLLQDWSRARSRGRSRRS